MNWGLGWCLSSRAKVSGHKVEGRGLGTESGAAPFGVLASTMGACVTVGAALAAKSSALCHYK